MTRVRVHCFSISSDGYGAGPEQSLERPLGRGGEALHAWVFATPTFRRVLGVPDPAPGGTPEDPRDDRFVAAGFEGIGAWILGRNMFGPVRGAWGEPEWRGWWGDEPPYHVPVYVLTHHPRPPLEMAGGTTFHFVTDGLAAALRSARDAAGGRDVRVGGGVATVRACLAARALDELHVAVAPVLLGRGEALFRDLDLPALGYRVSDRVATARATHLTISRSA